MTKNKLNHSFTITIPAKEFDAKMTAKLEEVRKEAKIQGFRPGQAPAAMIKSKYENAVKGEVLDTLVQEQVEKELKGKNIRPALRPKVELTKFEDGKDIELKIDVDALPEIKPVDLKTLEIKKITAEVSEKEIAEALEKLAQAKKSTEKSDEKRATKDGDVIVIDFVGSIDGKEFKGGDGKDYYLALGSNTFIPGFEEQLTGKNIGDKVDVNVSFPKDYHAKDLAGKKAVFKVDIKELRKYKNPEINDAFAKLFGAESLDKLKDMIKAELNKEYGNVSRLHTKRALLDVLADKHDFEIPQSMVDLEFDSIWKQFEEAKKAGQLDDDEKSKSEDELKKEYREIAERRVRLGLLLAEIANQNKVTLTQQDLTNAVMAEARKYPGQEKMVFEYYQKNPQALDSIKAPLFEEKVVDFILGVVKLSEEKMAPKDLYAYNPDEAKKKPVKKAK
ncbi:MAG: trigger factor [Lactobacillales bacterium]|jgi:trigger factor|nr:trigger factor [Lactobacillales bacterium]